VYVLAASSDTMPRVSMAEVNSHLVNAPGAGFVDQVSSAEPDVSIAGWAADGATNGPAAAVHIFVNGTDLLAVEPDVYRPDVSKALGSTSRQLFGFSVIVRPSVPDAGIKVFAQMHDGTFAELKPTGR